MQCAKLGIKPALLARIGTDSYGDDYMAQLKKEGVFADLIQRSKSLGTGTASISVDENGGNTIIIVPGANTEYSEEDVCSTECMIADAKVVLCQNEIPIRTTQKALELCKKHDTIGILNPAPASPDLRDLIPLCDMIIPNEVELAALTGLPTDDNDQVRTAAAVLLAMGCKVVVVTLGARGCAINTSQGDCHFITAPQAVAVDTVGAGDSFIGSLAAYLARGLPLVKAAELAVACASISVTRKGSQVSYPCLDEIPDTSSHPPALDSLAGITDGGKIDKGKLRARLGLL